ncbi:splicing factor U2AF-associated protein 2 [Lepidopterella palustris CBS 459.81]|uniref:Splicing factor U2AF-associated protein 2 n=1 Tax=Lepidopterella palustris CBS 459.81 TaxID=1314670 RepID=A0A8E2JI18_9PEZI|nr:splicing factor U2AF-associated protein 2 [Lepidopterella palustris CBS 459.81]
MAEPARTPFPRAIEEFENDDRISYSKTDAKWILEDDDGSEWEFNEDLNRWVQSLDEAEIRRQQAAYAVAGVDDTEPAQGHKKRKNEHENGSPEKKSRKDDKPKPERKNAAVYVTSLPLDATVEEVASVFSRCGVIAEATETGDKRIKLYKDEEGNFKGDALVVFFRPESVKLAIQLLDETDFRFGQQGPAGPMRVKEADTSYKKQQDAPPKATGKEKKKIVKNLQKLNSKLTDWDDDEPALPTMSSRFDKVVILKHMFTLQELQEDPAAILDIKEDIRDECSKLGEVTNVVLFDKEKDGVASVRFANVEAAKACVRLMSGRHFDGRTVVAFISDGSEKFKKTSEKKSGMFNAEDDEEDEKRLDEFGAWLEHKE